MKNKLNETDPQIKRTLIEAFIYRISINEDDVDIILYLDNLIDKNCDNIGGGEGIEPLSKHNPSKASTVYLIELI